MPGTKSFLAQELTNFFEAAWIELPAEAAKVMAGAGDERSLRKAGWKTYDAWISLANELTNTMYSDPIVGETGGRMMETALRLRQVAGTMAGAFFANFWPLIGLPTRRELLSLREELFALREELAWYAGLQPADGPSDADAQGSPAGFRNRAQLNGYSAANGNSNRRFSGQERRNVAA